MLFHNQAWSLPKFKTDLATAADPRSTFPCEASRSAMMALWHTSDPAQSAACQKNWRFSSDSTPIWWSLTNSVSAFLPHSGTGKLIPIPPPFHLHPSTIHTPVRLPHPLHHLIQRTFSLPAPISRHLQELMGASFT